MVKEAEAESGRAGTEKAKKFGASWLSDRSVDPDVVDGRDSNDDGDFRDVVKAKLLAATQQFETDKRMLNRHEERILKAREKLAILNAKIQAYNDLLEMEAP